MPQNERNEGGGKKWAEREFGERQSLGRGVKKKGVKKKLKGKKGEKHSFLVA